MTHQMGRDMALCFCARDGNAPYESLMSEYTLSNAVTVTGETDRHSEPVR